MLQTLYDVIVCILLVVAGVVVLRRGELWQLSIAIAIFCVALAIGLANRKCYERLKSLVKRKQ